MTREFSSELLVPLGIDKVFPFFSDPFNLEELTPPWLRFKILTTAPIDMRAGAVIDYRLSIRGLPVRWSSEITAWEPPHRFVDEQIRGPYRYWSHEHRFEPTDGGTLICDRVRYLAPGWILEPVLHRVFVRPDVERVFRYRIAQLEERFGVVKRSGPAGQA